MSARTARSPGIPIVARCHGIAVPEAPHFGPGMIAALKDNRYERREFEVARSVIAPGARILELGAGSGVVGAAVAQACAAEAMVSVEANPALLPHIEALHAANDLSDRIALRHGVVLAGPDAPATVPFLVRGNFLGSGLAVAKNPEKAAEIEVPVLRYDALRDCFPHDTLLMDIEGAERDFFAHADLGDIQTIVFETHRSIYGREGMRLCRRVLAEAGFVIDSEASKGGVHAWRRKTQQSSRPPRPERSPFSGTLETHSQALVVPERDHDARLACGVLRGDGSFAELSRGWIRAFKPTQPPTLSEADSVDHLAGTHLYAGHLRGHFGHFLVESTARLWAMDAAGIAPESVLYLPYRGKTRSACQVLEAHRPFFAALGLDLPIRVVSSPTRVEALLVPELGFGWRGRFAGSPAYRAFMRARLSSASTPEGGPDLYISRSRLAPGKGGLAGESVIEENLARHGYTVFHPEKHDLATQIARYRAARRIVALDGSALHLAAFVATPGARVAIILRRTKANHADYSLQFRSFAGITPDIVDAIRADWSDETQSRSNFRSIGEADFEQLFGRLAELGYIPDAAPLELPDAETRARFLEELGERRSTGLRPV